MGKLEILLSCMNAADDIAERSLITSDVLIADQCGRNDYKETASENRRIRRFYLDEKGLTKSRNFAIKHSDRDICLLCDDDEMFKSGYENGILNAYEELPDADIIIFDIGNRPTHIGKKPCKLGFRDLMSVSSWQISFRRKSIIDSGVLFDENMGAGTENGAEEELKFLTDCRKKKLKIYGYPFVIADVAQESSTWFSGFDEKFFVNRGNTTRYIMGLLPSFLYAVYYCFAKRKAIKKYMPPRKAFCFTLQGISENRLTKMKRKENGKNS